MQTLFKHLKKYLDQRTENSKEIYLTQSLQDSIDEGFKISAVVLRKDILDFGKPTELLRGNRYLLELQNVKKEEFSKMDITFEKSYINNPVYIGKNTKVVNSVIGPYVSIGNECDIHQCILSNCVIERNTCLTNVITENSIIGSNATVGNITKDNLIIGERSSY